MRDGIKLATTISLPDGDGPFPVILHRTPYNRNHVNPTDRSVSRPQGYTAADIAAFYTRNGYAVVDQDIRGRYGSEGLFEKYVSDKTDGVDVCAWILEQPWADGQILTMGMSFDAHVQTTLGAQNPKGLVGQVLDSGGLWNSWKGGTKTYGAYELKQIGWAMQEAQRSPEAVADPTIKEAIASENIFAWFTRMPWRAGHSPLRHHPVYEKYILDQWQSGPFSEYWQQLGIWNEGWIDQYSDASIVHVSSYYDPFPVTVVENYMGLKKAGKGPQRLILGPWNHGDKSARVTGDVDFGPHAPMDSWAGDWMEYRLRFFDHVAKGGVFEDPPVQIFIMGGGSGRKTRDGHLDAGGRWAAFSDWPIPETDYQKFYLREDGGLQSTAPTIEESAISYDFDPNNPVPSVGGNLQSLAPLSRSGPYSQVEQAGFFPCKQPYLPLASRPDVLVFETEPLKEAVELAGTVVVDLWISTDGPDTDFTAKIVDVYPANPDYPQGYAMILTDGIRRLRYVEDDTKERFRTPGELVQVKVILPPVANRFEVGHKIRIDVSSSNFPKYDVNSNTGEPEGKARRKRTALNTVFMDANRPSHAVLPIIPAKRKD